MQTQVEAKDPKGESDEKEEDAPADKRPTIKDPIQFDAPETTLNMIPTMGGKLLTCLADGGMQYLFAGARASAGVKSGRYMFEVRIVEALYPPDTPGRNKPQGPRQVVRVGFSTSGSSLLLGDSECSVCFDAEGYFYSDRKKLRAGQGFGRDQVIAVMVNLNAKSPNANTVSLFKNGTRASPPQPLPDCVKGKPLFPHVTFRNVSLQVHFGPQPLRPLPFTCRMLQEAAAMDLLVAKAAVPKDGKYDVLVPVGFPDEGTFPWLDNFLAKNPQYVELSDRKIIDWATKSGLWKPNKWKNSNDKPGYNFGIPLMDDGSIRRALYSMAAVVPRHYVIMEVRSNLIAEDRQASLEGFTSSKFKRIAQVVMGEPTKDFKTMVQTKILEEKQAKAEAEWKQRKLDREKKKAFEKRKQEAAEKHKMALEARKKAEEERKAKKEAEEAGKEGDTEMKSAEPSKESEAPAGEEDKEQENEADEDEEELVPATLTDEEKKLCYPPSTVHDIEPRVLNSSFVNFSLPSKSEGFDEVKYEWQKEAQAKEYLTKRVLEKKRTSRVEDLQPGEWFRTTYLAWQKTVQEWQKKQKDYVAKKRASGKKKDDDDDDRMSSADVADIFALEDITDLGGGEPLFATFNFEDWALMSLRCELYLLVNAFKKDVNDPDRVGIPENHLAFYWSRYFKKTLNPKGFGKDSLTDVVALVKDTATFEEDGDTSILNSPLADDLTVPDLFAKLTEEGRRERQRRIDAGDETVRLRFVPALIAGQPHKETPPLPMMGNSPAAAAAAAAAAALAAAKAAASLAGSQTIISSTTRPMYAPKAGGK